MFKLEALPAVNPPDVPVVFWLRVGTLADAMVPDAILDAFKLVKDEPLPEKVAAEI